MSRLEEVREFVREVDADLQRTFPFEVEEVRDSGSGNGVYTVKGHAAVFGKWSLDLGGFREKIERGAFENALSKDPHVLHLWDHDTSRALSSTRSTNYPLEIREDPAGLRYYSRVAPTAYAADLRVLMEGGVISQSSFAFTVAKDEWKISDRNGDEVVERTIIEVDQLFDVTTCAMGAYPTTDASVAVRNLSIGRRGFFDGAKAIAPKLADGGTEVAPEEPAGKPQAADEAAKPPEDREAREREFEKWQRQRASEYRRTREFAFGVNTNQKES